MFDKVKHKIPQRQVAKFPSIRNSLYLRPFKISIFIVKPDLENKYCVIN